MLLLEEGQYCVAFLLAGMGIHTSDLNSYLILKSNVPCGSGAFGYCGNKKKLNWKFF